ncbi:hypothetical protein [Streptomyces tendae]|uniref:hypothetical protein n=1 Tax=Streptomyces tendae TaxID=1932 RepID=UPI00342B624D
MSELGDQQSSERSAQNGIQALGMAYSARILPDMHSTKTNLAGSYQASDGGAYSKLLDKRDDQVNPENVIDKFNTIFVQHE